MGQTSRLRKCEVLSQGPSPDNGAVDRTEVAGQPKVLKRNVTTIEKPDGAHNMTGDRTAGSVGEISSELPHREGVVFRFARAEEPTGGSQSVHSSKEAANHRRAKGRRKVKA